MGARAATCGNCKFFGNENIQQRRDPNVYGTCRVEGPRLERDAERLRDQDRPARVGTFPFIASDEWCGRHGKADRTAVSVELGAPSLED